MCSFQPYLQFYMSSQVAIAMPILDMGMILVIVVLPVILVLMTPDSHKKRQGETKPKDESCEVSESLDEPSSDMLVQKDACAKYDDRFLERFAQLPEELSVAVAQFLDLKDVAAISTVSRHLKQTLQTSTVWKVLGNRYGIQIEDACVIKSRESVRLAAWRRHFDCIKDLAIEIKKHPPGDPASQTSKLLVDASRFIQKLFPCDEDMAMELCDLVRPSLTCHSAGSALAAQELVQSARRSCLPWVVAEDIANSYGHGLLHQNLSESCMQEHDNMLNMQLSELQASFDEESKMQIDYDLSTLLQVQ